MAQSRLEKVGTIYSRITKLLDCNAIKKEFRPLWLELYKAFPPKYEPQYCRSSSKNELKPLFYAEDSVRVNFHKDFKHLSNFDLIHNNISKTELFIKIYRQLKKDGYFDYNLYSKVAEAFSLKFKDEIFQSKQAIKYINNLEFQNKMNTVKNINTGTKTKDLQMINKTVKYNKLM